MHRFFWAAVVVLVAVSFSCQPADREEELRARAMSERFTQYAEHDPAVGTEAPNFVLSTLEGQEVRLTDFRDTSYVVLEFGSFT
jgi:hypothetical protein